MSELRWNALTASWVATAQWRQERTFLPADAQCPLCPAREGAQTGEIAQEHYEIAVLENRFPSLALPAPEPALAATPAFAVEPARGVCEVVLYTDDHHASLGSLSQQQLRNLVAVWTDRFQELAAKPEIRCVFIFENRGVEMGVTLHHPHGQIYAYPFVPPVIAAEAAACESYQAQHGRCLLCVQRESEVAYRERVVAASEHFTVYVPFAARWPFEMHVVANAHVSSLPEFEQAQADDLAAMLKRVAQCYDALFSRPFPYVMAIHQQPVAHFHVEFYPPLRTASRLKYLAGSELGAGMFINDTLPEESARALRAVFPS